MLKFNMITAINDIQNLSNKVLGHKRLPAYLDLEEKHTKLVIEMEKGNDPIGLVYGVIERRTNTLFLNFLFVKKKYRSYATVLSLLKSTFKTAIDIKGVKRAVWKYTLNQNETDSRLNFLLDIPFCHFRKIQRSQQVRIRTVDINYIRQFKIYNPALWRSKGYDVLTWSNSDESLLDKIKMRELEQSAIMGKNYISPFNKNDDNGQEYDWYHSYILVKAEKNEPMGWIMCSIISEKEVMIRNFYMYPEVRTMVIAHSFITYILDVIALRFQYLSFHVAHGNRQMEMIVKKYFKPILESSRIQCHVFVDFSSEGYGGRGER